MYRGEKTPFKNISSCQRCGGKVLLEKDWYGWYTHCIMCGHARDLSEKAQNLEVINVLSANPNDVSSELDLL
jgi:hypothetical protein